MFATPSAGVSYKPMSKIAIAPSGALDAASKIIVEVQNVT
jgi:hypothetical protein